MHETRRVDACTGHRHCRAATSHHINSLATYGRHPLVTATITPITSSAKTGSYGSQLNSERLKCRKWVLRKCSSASGLHYRSLLTSKCLVFVWSNARHSFHPVLSPALHHSRDVTPLILHHNVSCHRIIAAASPRSSWPGFVFKR